MSIYGLTEIGYLILELFTENRVACIFWGAIIGVVLLAGLFVLQGAGLYTMAKRLNIQKKWLAFVPFANVILLGKITGECQIFGQRMKRAGLYAMLAQIACVLATALYLAAELYLYLQHGAPIVDNNFESSYWGLTGIAGKIEKFYEIIPYVTGILELIAQVLFYVLIVGLCKKYAPHNYMFLSLLTLFVPMARFVLVFCLRKRQPINYEAYMRAKREAYYRRQQQYYQQYGNPYQNPYGRPYTPPQNPTAQKPQDPFEEFSNEPKGLKNKPTNPSDDEDEFFN